MNIWNQCLTTLHQSCKDLELNNDLHDDVIYTQIIMTTNMTSGKQEKNTIFSPDFLNEYFYHATNDFTPKIKAEI